MTITLMTNACQQLNQKKSEQMVPFKIREIAKCTLLPFFIFDQNNCVNCCFIFTWHWNTITNQKMGKVIEGYKKFPFSLHYSLKVTIFFKISLKLAPFFRERWSDNRAGEGKGKSDQLQHLQYSQLQVFHFNQKRHSMAIFSTPGILI